MRWIRTSCCTFCILSIIVYVVPPAHSELNPQSPQDHCSRGGLDAKSVLLHRSCSAIRGGGGTYNATETVSSPDSVIAEFLSAQGNDKVNCSVNVVNRFHVQGWRWHTLSFTRDTERLKKLAIRMLNSPSLTTTDSKNKYDENQHPLRMAVSYVVDFNLRGLRRVEDDLFFPWMREKLSSTNTDAEQGPKIDNTIIAAFKKLLDGIDDDRQKVGELANKLKERVETATSETDKNGSSTSLALDVIDLSNSICTLMKSISSKEECFLVPALAKIVPSKEQKSFNSKVLRKLGLFEARVHLVGMYDAVHDDVYGNKEEKSLFEQEIPTLPKMMISRWRKTLYQPRAGVLDDVDNDV